jgi:hypothetical protein
MSSSRFLNVSLPPGVQGEELLQARDLEEVLHAHMSPSRWVVVPCARISRHTRCARVQTDRMRLLGKMMSLHPRA